MVHARVAMLADHPPGSVGVALLFVFQFHQSLILIKELGIALG